MQKKVSVVHMRILVDMVDPFGIKQGRAPFDTVHDVALLEQVFCEISAVLAGYAGDEGGFGVMSIRFWCGGHFVHYRVKTKVKGRRSEGRKSKAVLLNVIFIFACDLHYSFLYFRGLESQTHVFPA